MSQFWKFSSILAVLALLVVMGLSTSPQTVHAQTPTAVVRVVGTGTDPATNPSRSISYVCSDASTPGDGCAAADAQFEIAVTDIDSGAAGTIATVNDTTAGDDYDPSRKVVIQNLDLPRDTAAPRAEDRNPKTIYLAASATTFRVDVVRKSTGLTSSEVDRTSDPANPVLVELPTDGSGVVQVKGFHGHRIRIAYSSGTGSIGTDTSVTVDDVKPTLVSNSPSTPLVVRGNTDITFSADITDGLAGYTPTNTLTAGIHTLTGTAGTLGAAGSTSTSKGGVRLVVAGNVIDLDNTNFAKIDGGWRVTKTLGSSALQNISTNVPWYFETRDRAGNTRRTSGSISGRASSGGAVTGNTDANAIVDRKFLGRLANAAFSGSSIRITREDANGNPVVSNAQPIETPADPSPTDGFAGLTATFTFENTLTDPLFGNRVVEIATAYTATADTAASSRNQFDINRHLYSCPLAGSDAKDNRQAALDAVDAVDLSSLTTTSSAEDVRSAVNSDSAASGAITTSNASQLGDCLSYVMGETTSYQILGSNLITVDSESPTLDAALTGKAYNPVTGKDRDNVKNSIKLTFGDKGKASGIGSDAPGSGLDAGTIAASAFSVSGSSVVAASLQSGGRVYLTLAENLSSTATPAVSVAGGVIRDKAGNAVDADRIDKASDGLGPNLTLSKSADLSNSMVTITITTDEQLSESPTVWITKAADADGTAKVQESGKPPTSNAVGTPISSGSVRQTGAQTYAVSMRATGSNDGEYSVFVRATDTATDNNPGTSGDAASSSTANAFSFELDSRLNGGEPPKVTVGDEDTVTEDGTTLSAEAVDPLIVTVDFSNEGATRGKEYQRDGYRKVELTSAKLKVTSADGTSETTTFNLTTDVSTPDNVKFTIPVLSPKIGTYELTVQAKDSAGNVRTDSAGTTPQDLKTTWKVISPRPVNVELAPGWNLISLPFQPGNPAINSVIPANHPADIVMTFDNTGQVWMVSRRDAETGRFIGDIPVLSASTAYFVRTDNFQPISVLRPPLATAAAAPPPPPAITVVEGWNLVPVVSNEIPTPDAIAADVYFGTLGSGSEAGWLKALTFDTLVRTWISVTPGSSVTLGPGDTNPCTDMPIDPVKVAAGTEPCQIGQYDEKSTGAGDYLEGEKLPAAPTAADATDPFADKRDTEGNADEDIDGARDGFIGRFDVNDRVTIGTPVTVGKGYWLYSTIDGVVIP